MHLTLSHSVSLLCILQTDRLQTFHLPAFENVVSCKLTTCEERAFLLRKFTHFFSTCASLRRERHT